MTSFAYSFAGTDEFSIESLEALHNESKKTDQIRSIDVLTKKDKPIGRGSKRVYAAPIKQTAIDLKLPLHQIDTFTGWTPPDVNLVIAVSFGIARPPTHTQRQQVCRSQCPPFASTRSERRSTNSMGYHPQSATDRRELADVASEQVR